jgi:ankyrin repeat protein
MFLASQGADVNAMDKYRLTPLHYAAMRGNDDAANDLLQIANTNLEVQKN